MKKDCIVTPEEYKQLTKDCFYHKLLKRYHELQRKIHSLSGNEKRIMLKYLDDLTPKAMKAIEVASCYPDECDHCPGMAKCVNCHKHDTCKIAS